ncbi:MAG: hypothetical protein MUF73_11330 [Rhodobacteraceae bacterium]|jgi:hypothetical protein|nr:hypothetical protein [Paracoccaceae bacterium]
MARLPAPAQTAGLVRAVLVLGLALLPAQAAAGAWPREDGRTFLSFGIEAGDGADGPFVSLFGERGLPRRWTAVLDAGMRPDGGDATAALTLRLPLDDGTGRDRFALSFGGGLAVEDGRVLAEVPGLGQARPFARAGAHWGRGIATPWGDGWAGVDAIADLSIPVIAGDDMATAWKLDATLGLRPTDRLATILQVQTGQPLAGDTYLRLQGTVVRRLGNAMNVEAGAVIGVSGDDTRAARLGVWVDF